MTDRNNSLPWEHLYSRMEELGLNHRHLLQRAGRSGHYPTLDHAEATIKEAETNEIKVQISDAKRHVEAD